MKRPTKMTTRRLGGIVSLALAAVVLPFSPISPTVWAQLGEIFPPSDGQPGPPLPLPPGVKILPPLDPPGDVQPLPPVAGQPLPGVSEIRGLSRELARRVGPLLPGGDPLPGDPPIDRLIPIPRIPIDLVGPELFGYVDLHIHPASFLAFGGREDGRRGMMWGRPAVGEEFHDQTFGERWGETHPHEDHTDDTSDPLRNILRSTIIDVANGRTRAPHLREGDPDFESWPHSLQLSHQQIDVPWLRRAYEGGLRAVVAATVDNEIISTAFDWDTGDLTRIADAVIGGDAPTVRASLGLPRPGFAWDTVLRQLALIETMADENRDWMEIALSGADARRIIASGKLAVVLALEMDSLTPEEVELLIRDHGVRLVTPIHFVNNDFGGAAAYDTFFSVLNGLIGRPPDDSAFSQPYRFLWDENVHYFQRPPLESASAEFDELTASLLGWESFGERCPGRSTVTDGRPGCGGRRNEQGLRDDGNPIRDLIAQGATAGGGVFVDLAHMSQESQEQALVLSEETNCPMVNTHTGLREDSYDPTLPHGGLGNERAMRESDARRMLAVGGIIGLGTGPGELHHPRRVYYNAGNPLIELSSERHEWRLDLRQPETVQRFADDGFSRYRVTVRIGADNVERGNRLRARLLGPRFETGLDSWTDTCALNSGTGWVAGSEHVRECALTSGSARLRDVTGLRLDHDGTCDAPCSGDNVDIQEVRLEALADDSRGWITLLQRTGGRSGSEGPVVRLKGPDAFRRCGRDMGQGFWTTRLLPERAALASISSLDVRTFTNEDDLGGSAPAALDVSLSDSRDPMRVEFGDGGISSDGACVGNMAEFDSGAEGPDGVESLRLATGPAEEGEALRWFNEILEKGELLNNLELFGPALVGWATATATSTLGFVIADPLTTILSIAVALKLILEHDNWATQVAIHAQTPEGRIPFLVNYNPTQRLKKDEPDSVLFRGLPEKIDPDRLYGAVVVNFSTVNEVGDEDLELAITFTDGVSLAKPVPGSCKPGDPFAGGYRVCPGREHLSYISFDRRRRGSELRSFALRWRDGGEIKLRSLDVGFATDPVETFAGEFARTRALGDFGRQITFGTDLSGFEPLIPFTAINMPEGDDYRFDIETAAGREDPARTTMGLMSPLEVDSIGERRLHVRESGVSTIGQLPDFAYAAYLADPPLGPDLFSSVDGFVRAWERLDAVTAIGPVVVCP